ncbi:F-box protein [Sesbania bispinosa]|nr:F-box protein [Sesbania bispinosa]
MYSTGRSLSCPRWWRPRRSPIGSLFRVDLLDLKDSVKTTMEYQRGEEACENFSEELRLSWIMIAPKGERSVNVSSGKVATVQQHWLSREVQVRFVTVVGSGERGSATKVALCSLMVTFGREM